MAFRHQGETVITLPGAPSTSWFSPIQPVSLAAVLLFVAVAIVLTRISRRPVMIIMVPIFGGILIQASGHVALVVPPLASTAAFCVIGWYSFTRESLLHSARHVPRIMGGIVAILQFCAGLALLLVKLTGVDFLTAYLALNPSGTDDVMLMGASISVNLPLIMTMQVTRLILVMIVAPGLGQVAAKYHLEMENVKSQAPADP